VDGVLHDTEKVSCDSLPPLALGARISHQYLCEGLVPFPSGGPSTYIRPHEGLTGISMVHSQTRGIGFLALALWARGRKTYPC
jgi:hypothetical protein